MPESNSSKCFSVFLSRLLCSGGLPTHPSEQLIESNTVKLKLDLDRKVPESEENAKRGSNPGVVARLMGLESFPAENDHQKERTLGDYFRSRSVNSIDFLSHLDPVNLRPRNDYRHRRVRTSVSFREGLDDELASVVLLLENENQMREKNRKEEREIQERRKSVYGKNVEITSIKDKRKPVVRGKSDLKKRTDLEGKRRADLKERRPVMMRCDERELKKKKKKKKKKILAQNLKFDSSKIQSEGTTTPDVARPSSPRKDEPSCSSNYSHCEGVIIGERNEGKMKMNENLWYKEMVEEICLLTEESARESWVYGMELKFDNFEEICRQFGHEILELMLTQFVDELFQYFGKEIKIN